MKILVTSDIHGNKNIIRKLTDVYEKSKAELLLICGDIGGKGYYGRTIKEFGEYQSEDYKFLVNELSKIEKPFRCILGNDDWFDISDDFCLKTGETLDNIIAFDLVHITPFNTNREANENKIEYELSKMNIDENSIVLAHCPPYGLQDKIHSGLNVGSKAVRRLIEKSQPKIWLCGGL